MFKKKKFFYNINEHVEIGKQSFLKKRWNYFLKSSSLFVRMCTSDSVPPLKFFLIRTCGRVGLIRSS